MYNTAIMSLIIIKSSSGGAPALANGGFFALMS